MTRIITIVIFCLVKLADIIKMQLTFWYINMYVQLQSAVNISQSTKFLKVVALMRNAGICVWSYISPMKVMIPIRLSPIITGLPSSSYKGKNRKYHFSKFFLIK